jgi:glycolate oxidase FAD binding subunit
MPERSLTSPHALAERLVAIMGTERVEALPATVIHGMGAVLEVRPADEQQLAAVLALAGRERLGVCVAGGGTKLAWGDRPAHFDLLVRTTGLPARCDVDADDLTLTVAAGVSVAEARAQALALRRVLPLDAGVPSEATVGGVAATGDQGARGAAYGAVRDVVLGLRATLADGTAVRFGGRTMKNVAGYDMTKLFVGSFGALGVITEVTFRLLPLPDSQALTILPLGSLDEGRAVAARILDSCLQPLVLEAVSPGLADWAGLSPTPVSPSAGVLLAAFGGHGSAVERSVCEVSALAGGTKPTILGGAEAEEALERLTGFSAVATAAGGGTSGPEGASLKARGSVPLSAAWGLVETALSMADSKGLGLAYRMGVARGIVDLWVGARPGGRPNGASHAESLAAWTAGVRQAAVAAGGQLTVTGGLESLPPGYSVWGEPGASVAIMKRIKERLDPNGTLNPGRSVGGI